MEPLPLVLPAASDLEVVHRPERPERGGRVGALRVGGELEEASGIPLLEPLGKERDHGRPGLLRPRGRDGHREAPETAQRNAERSFSKKPTSVP